MLKPGVIAARMLLNDGHKRMVAYVCNYSRRPYEFKVDSFLGLAELVSHVTGADGRAVGSSLVANSGLGVSGQPDVRTAEVAGFTIGSDAGLDGRTQCF